MGYLGLTTRPPSQIKGKSKINILEVTVSPSLKKTLKMFAYMESRSSLKLGYCGKNIGHQVKLNENLVNTQAVTYLK